MWWVDKLKKAQYPVLQIKYFLKILGVIMSTTWVIFLSILWFTIQKIRDALRYLIPFVQFKKRQNCKNGTKSRNAPHMVPNRATHHIYPKMYSTSSVNNHHDVTVFKSFDLNYKKLNISRTENDFLRNTKILKLCRKSYIFRCYHFLTEITFNGFYWVN